MRMVAECSRFGEWTYCGEYASVCDCSSHISAFTIRSSINQISSFGMHRDPVGLDCAALGGEKENKIR